ncbi:MAG: cytochrome C [Rhodocyclaceae bacterium]|nr:cytochrome C [Rhodocyclaceae bacterium]
MHPIVRTTSRLLACVLLACLAATASAEAAPAAKKGSTADHGKFKELQGPFHTGEEVTTACLKCHTEAAKQVMATRHWTWDYTNPVTGQRLGKKTMLNSFCIADRSNEAFCNACHVGYGWKDDSFDFTSEKNVDCLACHNTGQYAKIPGLAGHPPYQRMEFPPKSGKFVGPVDLADVAARVGRTSRETCGACHFYGGGGDGVKHGDLDSSLKRPDRKLDRALWRPTAATSPARPATRPRATRSPAAASRPPPPTRTGQSCAAKRPHATRPPARLATATARIMRAPAPASSAAWAPARASTPIRARWPARAATSRPSPAAACRPRWPGTGPTAGTLDAAGKPFVKRDAHGHVVFDSKKGDFTLGENVVPDYVWFDGRVEYTLVADRIDPAAIVPINRFGGSPGDPAARIWPVKRFRGKQPYDLEHLTLLVPHTAIPNDTALWFNFDWDKALAAGTAAAGQPFSGKYGFAATEMLWPITHMVAPEEDALRCAECHAREGRLKDVAGVYLPGRDRVEWLDPPASALRGWPCSASSAMAPCASSRAESARRQRNEQSAHLHLQTLRALLALDTGAAHHRHADDRLRDPRQLPPAWLQAGGRPAYRRRLGAHHTVGVRHLSGISPQANGGSTSRP